MNRRNIPPVHEVLNEKMFVKLEAVYPRPLIKEALTHYLDRVRKSAAAIPDEDLSMERIHSAVLDYLKDRNKPNLKRVINATGTVLHTNLGRAPLPEIALQAMIEVCRGYCNLELDLSTGRRGHRFDHVAGTITELTGAESALVVNNNAGAVLLMLSVLAGGKEVIVSRGELIEIGGGFRIPDVMAQSGAVLKEVGTTNRTHPADFERAITTETGLLFKAYYSNFAMLGFTSSVGMSEMAEISKRHHIPFMFDLGSGCLMKQLPGQWKSITVQECIETGVDIVTFSGDKLLGGPQAGIIAGKKAWIDQASRHPLARALRIDKLTISALEAVLSLYRSPRELLPSLPVYNLLTQPEEQIKRRAVRLARRLNKNRTGFLDIAVSRDFSAVGGGALPMTELPTWVLEIHCRSVSTVDMSEILRSLEPPVMARIRDDLIVLDVRTILPGDEPDLIRAFHELVKILASKQAL